MHAALIAYFVSAMVAWVPISQHAYHEKAAETEARYRSIAEDAYEASVDNPIFAGAAGAERTALLALSTASYEGSFAKSIDDCRPPKGTSDADADGNPTAWTIWQMHVEPGRTPPKAILCSSRKVAAAAFVAWAKESFRLCRALAQGDRMSFYATGRCGENAKSRARVGRAIDWENHHPIPKDES